MLVLKSDISIQQLKGKAVVLEMAEMEAHSTECLCCAEYTLKGIIEAVVFATGSTLP